MRVKRFRRGQRVRVYEDVEDTRYAGRMGTVLEVLPPSPPYYPKGCVAVRLAWPAGSGALFGRTSAPRRVHFAPGDLDRRPYRCPTP